MDTSLYLTTRATTVIRSRFSIPRAIESPRPARTWSDRALLLRRRDTSITFLAPRGPHEACAPLGTLFIGLRGPWMMGTFVGSVAVSRFGVEVTTPGLAPRCSKRAPSKRRASSSARSRKRGSPESVSVKLTETYRSPRFLVASPSKLNSRRHVVFAGNPRALCR